MKHPKKARILLSVTWAVLGVLLIVLCYLVPGLGTPLSVTLFLYAILTPAMVAGMYFLKRREQFLDQKAKEAE